MQIKKWHLCVLIPACNEEALLSRCLKSVLYSITQLDPIHRVEVVLAVDSSTDNSYAIGQELLQNHGRVIQVALANVGYARKMATQHALQNYIGDLANCWLANTDADCIIPSEWLAYQLVLANQGYQGVTGIVDVDSFDEHAPWVPQKFKETYQIHADGTHPHVHGANLGVRADAYMQAGEWSAVKTAEDHDLWNRLKKLNISLISDAKLCVKTSGRKIGRAPDGFAQALARHN